MKALSEVGQIKKGDQILCIYKGSSKAYEAKEILFSSQPNEEILLDVEENLYFITSMAIDGSSWAKKVLYAPVNQ